MTLLIGDGEALPGNAQTGVGSESALPPVLERDLRWFAVYVSTRHEKRVSEHLGLREMESFLPLYRAVHRWRNGCNVKLELPLFPNYLFVRMDARERVRVLQVPGVVSLVCQGRIPAPIAEPILTALKAAVASGQIEPHPYLVIGHRVRIKAGPLAGLEGVLKRKKDNLCVVLSVEQIMQSAAVEVAGNEVEDLGAISVTVRN